MFTGIVASTGVVEDVDHHGEELVLTIRPISESFTWPLLGGSVSCSGACLTVIDKDSVAFRVRVSATSQACTTIGRWRAGDEINLESSLTLGAELGGHLVLGHVDAVATVEGFVSQGDSVTMTVGLPASLMSLCAVKGSVTLDGVSLTINALDDVGHRLEVNLIPYTLAHTNFRLRREGDGVNVEVDLIARYLDRLRQACT